MSGFVSVPQGTPQWRATAVGVGVSVERVAAYLPSNFRAHEVTNADGVTDVVITGTDVAGWTMADYVSERLASGCIFLDDVQALPDTSEDWQEHVVDDDLCVDCRTFQASRSQDYPDLCPSCAADSHRWRDAP